MPVSTRAIPTTMLKIESCSAMYETLSAVESAVSVTHRFSRPVRDRLPAVILRSGSFVAGSGRIVGIRSGLETAHLRVRQSA